MAVGFGAAYMVKVNNQGGGGELPPSEPQSAAQTQGGGDCTALCDAAAGACPSMINKEICAARCPEFDESKKEALAAASSCEQLSKTPELVAELAIPDNILQPEPEPAHTGCQAACANYVNKCLTLVPGANQSLYDEGTASCLAECANWYQEKIDCLKAAADCPAMTEQCGL